MSKEIRAVIFDMDGLMVNTLPLHQRASRLMWARHGIDWTPQLAQNIIGMRIDQALQWELDRSNLDLDLDQLVTEREEIYRRLLAKDCNPMHGLNNALNQLQGKYQLAIASSSERSSVDIVLDGLGIRELFEAVTVGSDVPRSKPFPDIYLKTANKLEMPPNVCVVVEDADHGVNAGWLAGMHVIAIPNQRTKKGHFSKATKILSSLDELDGAITDIAGMQDRIQEPFKYQSVADMYGIDDLSKNPIFPKFINYGYWKGIDVNKKISLSSRINASANLYRDLLNTLGVNPSHDLLEVASGNGRGGALIHEEYQPHLYIGVDLSYKQALRTKSTLDTTGIKNNTIAQASAQSLPFVDDSFDRIISVEAIQHFPQPQEFINESYRSLKPGGKVGFCSFFMDGKGDQKLIDKMFPTSSLGIDHFNSIHDIHKWLNQAGFKNISIKPIGNDLWDPFVKWCKQVQPDQDWSENWIIAYKMGMVDYFEIVAEK